MYMAELQLLPVAPNTPTVGDSAAPRAADAASGESFGQALTQAKGSSGENNNAKETTSPATESASKADGDTAEKAAAKASAKANKAKRSAKKHAPRAEKLVKVDVPKLPISRQAENTSDEIAKMQAPEAEAPAVVPEDMAKPSNDEPKGTPTVVVPDAWLAFEDDRGEGHHSSLQLENGVWRPAEDTPATHIATSKGNAQTETPATAEVKDTLAAELKAQTDQRTAHNEIAIAEKPTTETRTDAEIKGNEEPQVTTDRHQVGTAKALDGATERPKGDKGKTGDSIKVTARHENTKQTKTTTATALNPDQNIKATAEKSQANIALPAETQEPVAASSAQAPQQTAQPNASATENAKGSLSLEEAAKALPSNIVTLDDSEDAGPDFEIQAAVQKDADAATAKAPQAPQAAPLLIESALPQSARQTKAEAPIGKGKGEDRAVPKAALEGKATATSNDAVKGVSETTAKDDRPSTTAQIQKETPKEATGETKAAQNTEGNKNAAPRPENRLEATKSSEAAKAAETVEAVKTAETVKINVAPEKPREQTATMAPVAKAQQTAVKADAPAEQTIQPTKQQTAPAENVEQTKQTAQTEAPSKQPSQTTAKADAPVKQTDRTAAKTNTSAKPTVQPERATAKPDAPVKQTNQTKVQPETQAKEVNAPVAAVEAPAERPSHASEALERAKPSSQQMNMAATSPKAAEATDETKEIRGAKSFENIVFRAEVNLTKDSASKGVGLETKTFDAKIHTGHSEGHFAVGGHSNADVSGTAQKQPTASIVHRQFLPPQAPMSQLEGSVKWLLRSNAKGAEIQLHPESLGRVTVQLKVEGSDVHAKVWASEASTMPLLKEQKAFLESSLKDQGLTLSSFDLQHGKGGHQAQGEADRHHQHFAPPMRETWTGTEFRQEMPTQIVAQHIDESGVEVYA